MVCFGIPMSAWALRILYILDNTPYVRLNGGLTEDNIGAVAIVGVLLAVVGIVLIIFGKMKRKNKEISDSIENSGKLNYCGHCRTNVNSTGGRCPICNQKIGG